MKHIIVVALAATGYMSETLPTVLIQTPNGPVRINESDFDPETMKQVDAVEAPVEPEPVVISAFDPETVAAPEQLLVMKSDYLLISVQNLCSSKDSTIKK
jgi:hypothetical protein